MKKTFITLLAVVGIVTSAQAATMLADWNGITSDGKATTGDLTLNMGNAVLAENGELTVYGTDIAYRPYVSLSTPGMSVYNGFSVSMKMHEDGVGQGAIFFSVSSSATEYLLSNGVSSDDKAMFLFNGSSDNVENLVQTGTLIAGGGSQFSIVTFTGAYNATADKVLLSMYENGSLVGSCNIKASSLSVAKQEISKLTLGGWGGASNNDRTGEILERLSIFNGAMSDAEVAALYAAWTAVPEPATASLSLLGLATLMMRRRRA